MSNLFIDFHAIQAVGPANINRDDSGAPKSTVFGGVRRARVSSQAWKRAIRRDFSEKLDPQELGQRTCYMPNSIAEKIMEKQPDLKESAVDLAIKVLKASDIKIKEPKKSKKEDEEAIQQEIKTEYLLFLSPKQIDALAELAVKTELENKGKFVKKEVKAAINSEHSIDVALFGRMIAGAPDLKADACCQVAHAVSVHPLEAEFDYFTAVDDKAPDDNAGAGMIGTVEFNASTFYRYATINVGALIKSLGSVQAAAKTVAMFAESFAVSMPTGKQNTFANRTRPEFFAVSIRKDQPVNLVDAFEDAINSRGSRIEEAVNRLAEHSVSSDKAYGSLDDTENYYLATGPAAKAEKLGAFGESHDLPELVDIVETTVLDLNEEE